LYFWLTLNKFLSIAKLFGLSIFLLVIPTITSIFLKNAILRTLLDSFIFCITFLFLCWYFSIQLSLKWYLIACGLVFAIEWGGFLNKLNASFLLYSLRKKEEEYSQKFKKIIHKSMLMSSFLYLSIPLAIFIGGSFGIIQGKDIIYSVKIALFLVFSTATVLIFIMLIFNFAKMSSKLVGLSPQKYTSFDDVLETAIIVTKARQVFLYDSLHDIILSIVVVYINLNILGIDISPVIWFSTFLLLSFLFNNIPFVIGQRQFHESALENYSGLEREQKKKHSYFFPVILSIRKYKGRLAKLLFLILILI
jgi:hypothetical protein